MFPRRRKNASRYPVEVTSAFQSLFTRLQDLLKNARTNLMEVTFAFQSLFARLLLRALA